MRIDNKYLRKLRRNAELSQIDLAKKIGINRSTYSDIENLGDVKKIETLYKLAEFFNISINELLLTNEKPKPEPPPPIFPIDDTEPRGGTLRQPESELISDPKEIEYIHTFRSLSEKKQELLRNFMKDLSEL